MTVAGPGGVAAPETVEGLFRLARRERAAGVGQADVNGVVILVDLDVDRAAFVIYDNQFQCQVYAGTLAAVDSLEGLTFEGNTWFTLAKGRPFRLGRGRRPRELSFREWVAASGEKRARFEKIAYPDADRSIESYMRTLGHEGTDDELYARFFAEARKMRRGDWRAEFTARAINGYFRKGFAMEHIDLDKLPAVLCGPFEPRFSCLK